MPKQDFQILAKEAFAFLEINFGFKLHLLTKDLLRYETQDVFVLIGYDSQRSYELSLDLGQINSTTEQSFNFGEMLRSIKAPHDVASSYQVSSEQELKQFLDKLAQALQTYGAIFLKNDAIAFERLAQLRERECKEYALERNLRAARAKAEVAWRSKNYEVVVATLEPFRAALTATEIGKLEFSEKQTAG
ncbi:MAG TPA: hypothetical protein VK810_05700 [Dongiaceae bacterium]|jgi:hypothetical protein|nr:hypothetical protein [Dongiaceae bacterium]